MSLIVAQFNVLSQRCATTDERGFPHVDPSFLDEGHRATIIACEIMKKVSPDVVCMQEFDETIDGRASQLALALFQKYHFVTTATTHHHGLCIALRRDSHWSIVSHDHGSLSGKKWLGAVLQNSEADAQQVAVITTHLKAGCDNSDIRFMQMCRLISLMQEQYAHLPILLCADFNCDPQERAYHLLQSSLRLGLVSVYEAEELGEGHFTTIKARNETKCMCEDYIMHSFDVKVEEKRQLPARDSIAYPYLPNEYNGSDHLMLWCKCTILK